MSDALRWKPFEGKRFVWTTTYDFQTRTTWFTRSHLQWLIEFLGGTLLTRGTGVIELVNDATEENQFRWSAYKFLEEAMPPPHIALEWLRSSTVHEEWLETFGATCGLTLGPEASLVGSTLPPSLLLLVQTASDSDFSGVNLQKTSFIAAHLPIARVDRERRVWERPSFRGANLQDVVFRQLLLHGADFRGATLQNVTFDHCSFHHCLFEGATLDGVTLQNPEFTAAFSVSGALVSGSTLSCFPSEASNYFRAEGSDFTGFTLVENFEKSKLSKARIPQTAPTISFANADLSGADLSGADLSVANLSGAVLAGTKLTGARLDYAWVTREQLATAVDPPALSNTQAPQVPVDEATQEALALWENARREGVSVSVELLLPKTRMSLLVQGYSTNGELVFFLDNGKRAGHALRELPRIEQLLNATATRFPEAVLERTNLRVPRGTRNARVLREAIRSVVASVFSKTPKTKNYPQRTYEWPTVAPALLERLATKPDDAVWDEFVEVVKPQDRALANMIALARKIALQPPSAEREQLEQEHKALFVENHARWLGPFEHEPYTTFRVRLDDFGFFEHVSASTKGLTALQALVQHPAATLLRRASLRMQSIEKAVALLEKLPVHTLWIEGKKLSDVSALANLSTLRELHLSHARSIDLSTVARLTQLRVLTLDEAPLEESRELSRLEALQTLGLFRSKLPRDAKLPSQKSLLALRVWKLAGARKKLAALPKRIAVTVLETAKELPSKGQW